MMSEDLYGEEFVENDLETFEDVNEIGTDEQVPAENEENENDNKQPVKPKRIIRNPQPKLNAETLNGKRGLTALQSHFERVKYKGRGYEEQDLSVILKTYEYWCHRLFPKYAFDECIAKIDKLGSKKAVQTHIKRIRMDLVCEDEPILNENDNDSLTEETPNYQFDDLLDTPGLQTPIELTDEQQERIRLNREKAEKLRQEKLRKITEKAESSLRESDEVQSAELLSSSQATQLSIESTNLETQNSLLAQTELPSDQEEDVDTILNQIQHDSLEQETNHQENYVDSSNINKAQSSDIVELENTTLQKQHSDKESVDAVDEIMSSINIQEDSENCNLNHPSVLR